MLRFRWLRRSFGLILMSLLSISLVMLTGPMATSQVPLPSLSPSASPGEILSPPSDVRRVGNLEVAPVTLGGQRVFEIAAPIVQDRANPQGITPVEIRAEQIQANLRSVLALNGLSLFNGEVTYGTRFDPDSLSIGVAPLRGQTVITANDANRTEPQIMLTVTEADATYYGVSRTDLAERWRDRLQTVLAEELESRQPAALTRWAQLALMILAGLLLLSFLGSLLVTRLNRRRRLLKRLQARESTPVPPQVPTEGEPTPGYLLDFPDALKRYFDLDQRIRWLDVLRWFVIWLLILVWLLGIAILVDELPLLQVTALEILVSPVIILVIWGVTGLVNRLADIGINRFVTFWRVRNASDDVQRRSLRITTIANVLKGLKTFLVYLLAVLIILEILGFSTQSVLAFGAIVGFAVSLASQNLIRDLVNGFLIVLEDQYAIGDVISVDGTAGLVENLNLRTTHLRNGEGRLIILPNSLINRVENLTRSWARVDHAIELSLDTNVNQALQLIRDVAQGLYDDPKWRPLLVEPPEVLGIDDVSPQGILIRTWIKTQPLQQWAVGREFRYRLQVALEEAGIQVGMLQPPLWSRSPEEDAEVAATNGDRQPFPQS